MALTAAIAALALGLGLILPLCWGVWGFLAGAAALFVLQAAVNAISGFAGSSLEESLILFNGSLVSYLGFNLQITHRAFAPVLLALAVPLVVRLTRSLRRD